MAILVGSLGALSGCFVGYPAVQGGGQGVWLPEPDTGFALDDPPCDAQSIEPDDAEQDDHVSQFGGVTATARTFCGHISEASNDGQSFTGDIDYAMVDLAEGGRLNLVLSWDNGRTELALLVQTDPAANTWEIVADGVGDVRMDAGFAGVAVAGLSGPDTDYQLDAWVE